MLSDTQKKTKPKKKKSCTTRKTTQNTTTKGTHQKAGYQFNVYFCKMHVVTRKADLWDAPRGAFLPTRQQDMLRVASTTKSRNTSHRFALVKKNCGSHCGTTSVFLRCLHCRLIKALSSAPLSHRQTGEGRPKNSSKKLT